VDADRAQGHGIQVFVVLEMGLNARRRAEATKVQWLLWNGLARIGDSPACRGPSRTRHTRRYLGG
jgi:hypothetical protein